MSILLPTQPAIRGAVPRLIDFGGILTPPAGGELQKLNRIGDRYSFTARMEVMPSEPTGRIWGSRLRRAQREGAIFPFWQDLDVGEPGTVLVNGAGQLGSFISLKGFEPGYTVREGQFFNIIVGGRHFLYEAAADTVANNSGALTLPLNCMIRAAALNNAVCRFVDPVIEGLLIGGTVEPELLLLPWVQIPEFTIMEVA